MDSKQLIASLVSSLAWPAAVVCVAVLFRTQLKTLLTERLRHIEAGPIKADFDLEVSKVQATLSQAGVPVPAHTDSDDLVELGKHHAPKMVFSEAFAVVEHELDEALKSSDEPPSESLSGMALAQAALNRGLITPLTLNAIEGIASMRNLAVHGPSREITSTQVDEYLTLVETVLYAVRQNISKHDRAA